MVQTVSSKFLPLAAMDKVLKEGGAERVSEPSKVALKEVLEERARKIAEQAIQLALHSGRKTVKGSDVKLAAKQLGC